MKLTELFTATGEPFNYYPGLIQQFNISVNATVFLCFIAWRTFEDELDGWKPLSVDGVEKATGLSVKEQANARKQLVQAGLIEERYARLEHKLKFRIVPAEIAVSPYAQTADAHTPKRRMPIRPNGVSFKELEGGYKGIKEDNGADAPAFGPQPLLPKSPSGTGNEKFCVAQNFEQLLPASLAGSGDFCSAWVDWLSDRKARRKPVTQFAAKRQLAQLEKWGLKKAIEALNTSITNGWQGLFEPKSQQTQSRPKFQPAGYSGIKKVGSGNH